MAGESTNRPRQEKNKKYVLIRYSRMYNLDWFEYDLAKIPKMPTRVVIKTEKGLELGNVVGQLSTYKGGQFKLSKAQVMQYFENSEIEFSGKTAGKIIRFATAEDLSEERHLKKIAQEEIKFCKQSIKELNLSMKIIDAEHIFGGERVIFYFMAEARVDFRQLVKKLAHAYQTRIEMRQIGSRDEAKMLGDYETCGQQCCCQRFLKALKPVNMRMAKTQKATLDPSKISGYCGRLKCCFRYEDETYIQLKKRLPKKNTLVKTSQGTGRVLDSHILTQMVIVKYDDGRRSAAALEEIEILSEKADSANQPRPDREQKSNPKNRNNSRNSTKENRDR